MKKLALPLLITALLVPATAALAETKMDEMKSMDMAKKPAAAVPIVHKATGTVKRVDVKAWSASKRVALVSITPSIR